MPIIKLMYSETYYSIFKKLIETDEKKALLAEVEKVLQSKQGDKTFLYQQPLFVRAISSEDLPTYHGYIGSAVVIELYFPSWKITVVVPEKGDIEVMTQFR